MAVIIEYIYSITSGKKNWELLGNPCKTTKEQNIKLLSGFLATLILFVCLLVGLLVFVFVCLIIVLCFCIVF